jgi:hypothetical protein
MPHPDIPPVRLHARHVLPPFTLPAVAWRAIESLVLSSSARPLPFAERPADAEEATVLGVYLDSVLSDAGRGGNEPTCCGPARTSSAAMAGRRWWRGSECNGFAVEGGKTMTPAPSAN